MTSLIRMPIGARLGLAAVLVLGAFLTATNLPFAKAATFVVTSTADTSDLNPGDATCEISVGGLCTLRAAIEESNALAGIDVIQIGAGTYNLGSVLPVTTVISIAPVNVSDVVVITGSASFQVNGGDLSLSQLTFSGISGGPVIEVLAGTLNVTGSTFSGNSGGAIAISGGTATIATSTISGNTGGVGAAGVDVTAGGVSLTRVTIAGNVGGISAGAGSVTLAGSIVAGNTGAIADCDGTLTISGANIVQTPGSGCTALGATSADPLLGALANNGGPTFTRQPSASSPAIDAAGACSDIDQRGVSRPRGGGCDLGAVELPVVSFTELAYAGDDGANTIGLLGSIGSSLPFNLSVSFSLSGGTAVSGTDYSGTSGSMTFLAGFSNATGNVSLLRNTAITGNRTFNATLTPTAAIAGNGPATITITDVDAPVISWSATSYTVSEAGTQVTVQANLDVADAQDVTVTFSTIEGTARQGVEYTPVTGGAILIPQGSLTATTTVAILNNTWDASANRSFTVRISAVTHGTFPSPDATVTITDDEGAPLARMNPTTYAVDEPASGSTPVNLTITVPYTSEANISVDYATANDTARDGADYTAAVGTATILAGTTSINVPVAVLANAYYSGSQAFTFAISGPSATTPASATVTITDDETSPLARLSSTTYSATEPSSGSTPANLTITLPYTSETNISVDYATANGSANAGADYTAAAGTATITTGNASVNVPVSILANGYYSGSQTFSFTISGPASTTPTSATVTITDEEAIPTASIGSPSPFTEGAGSVGIGATLPYTSEIAIDVTVTATNGTAVAGADYSLPSGTFSFPAASNSASIAVTILENGYYSGQQAFQLQLTGQSIGAPNTTPQTVLINDNETPPSINLSASAYTGAENTTAIPFELTVGYTSEVDIQVPYTFVDVTAVAGRDHTAASGTATLTAGASTVNLSVPLLNNGYHSGSRGLTVQLGTQSPGTTGTTNSAAITITDDEGVPSAFIQTPGDSGGYTVGELALNAVVTVTLPYTSTSPINVSFATQNDTATAGTDYSAVASSLEFLAGQSSGTVSIPILNNNVNTGDRYFVFRLISQTQGTLGSPTSAQITIIDAQQPPKVQFTLPSFNVARNIGTAPITVTLNAASGLTVTVAYTMSNGTALAGVDYTASSGTLTFTPGMTTTLLQVPILNSGLYVGDRSFNLGLHSPGQATLGDNPQTTVLIRETNARRIYLIQIRNAYEPYSENEPNGTLATAKGPLASGATYRGGFNASQVDQYGLDRDTWRFTVDGPGQVTVTVISNDTGRQVKLLNASGADIPGGFSGDPGASTTFTVNVTAAGTYYVRVFSSAQLGTQQYQLRVTHP